MNDVEEYCLARSRLLRLRSQDARWLVHLAAAQLPTVAGMPQDAVRARLATSLENVVRDHYGNPVVVWVLLNVVVPIVVRLVIEWWLHRTEA